MSEIPNVEQLFYKNNNGSYTAFTMKQDLSKIENDIKEIEEQ